MSDTRGVPGSSTSPSDEGGLGQQQRATEVAAAAANPTTTTINPSQQQRLLLLQQQIPVPALDAKIKSRLIANGERDRLKRLLAERLEQCGWRDQLTAAAAAHLASTEDDEEEEGRERKSGDALPRSKPTPTTTSAQLAAVLTPAAQAAVPDSVKAELLAALRASVLSA